MSTRKSAKLKTNIIIDVNMNIKINTILHECKNINTDTDMDMNNLNATMNNL